MGLRKPSDNPPSPAGVAAGHWMVPLVIGAVCAAIAIFGDEARDLLRYDRPAIADGEWWRLLTGHFAHLGWPHLAMNMAGLLLVWILIGRHFRVGCWSWILLVTLVTISAGFWFISSNLLWYVGFSGILHGIIVAGAVAGLRALPGESAVLLLAIAAKLAWEQFVGPLPGSESTAGGNVVVEAHFYGAIGGAISAATIVRGGRRQRPI